MARYRYWPIFVLLAISLSWTVLGPQSGWARVLNLTLQGAALLLALVRAGRPARLIPLAVAGLIVTTLTLVVSVAIGTASGGVAGVAEAAVTAAAALAIFAGLWRQLTITVQSITGALCVYLLIGMFFANIDGSVAAFSAHSFFASEPSPSRSDLAYFSFVTLTTTGYGDFVPAIPLARLLAIVEALIGQLYLVSVVALVVGNLGRTRPARRQ